MRILLLLATAAVVPVTASRALAQACENSTVAEPYTYLVNLPGILSVTPLTFSSSDDGQATVTLPFTFNFLGTGFNTVNLGSNGVLTFGAEDASSLSNPVPGLAPAPNNWIAMVWDDLEHPSASNARWGVIGGAPHRIFVIEGGPASRYAGYGGTLYYQAWLYEGSDRFDWKATGDPGNPTVPLSYTSGYEGAGGSPSWDARGCGSDCSLTQLQRGLRFMHVPSNNVNVVGTASLDVVGGVSPGLTFVAHVVLQKSPASAPPADVAGRLYLSQDGTWSLADAVLATHTEPAMAGGEIRTADIVATVPWGTPPGAYHVFWVADPDDAIVECLETDNAFEAATAFATATDERPVNVVAAGNTTLGADLDLALTMANDGVLMPRQVQVQLFASLDDTLNPTDVFLGIPSLTLHAVPQEVVTVPVTIDLGMQPGTYHLFVVVDPQNFVAEANETNNVVRGGLLVVEPDVCGDGRRTGLEGCDDGNTVTDYCLYGYPGCVVCAADCQLGLGLTQVCGDGVVSGDETCDDWNAVTELCGYGQMSCLVCAQNCQEVPGGLQWCGDGILQPLEMCDDGNLVRESCPYGTTACLVCDACGWAVGIVHVCGDLEVTDNETCDDGNTVTERCAYGQASCMVCDATCALVAGQTSRCGDGTRTLEEACDDSNTITEACVYGVRSCVVCDATCALVAGAATYCGDGTLTAPEACDDGNTTAGDGCSAACTVEAGTSSSTSGSSGAGVTSGFGGSSAVVSSGTGMSATGSSGVGTSGMASSAVVASSSGVSSAVSGGTSTGGVSTGSSTMMVSSVGGGRDEAPDNRRCTCAALPHNGAPLGLVLVVLTVLVRRRR